MFTVFSTSKDHGQGKGAMAGCILVDFDRIQVINRSPAYKDKYVHHRSSMGVDLSDSQVSRGPRCLFVYLLCVVSLLYMLIIIYVVVFVIRWTS